MMPTVTKMIVSIALAFGMREEVLAQQGNVTPSGTLDHVRAAASSVADHRVRPSPMKTVHVLRLDDV